MLTTNLTFNGHFKIFELPKILFSSLPFTMISGSLTIFLSLAKKARSVKPETGIRAFLLKLPLLLREKLEDPTKVAKI